MSLEKREPLRLGAVLLEEQCPACSGTGKVEDSWRRGGACGMCEGAGVALTEDGRSLLAFVMAYLKSVDSNILIAKRDL